MVTWNACTPYNIINIASFGDLSFCSSYSQASHMTEPYAGAQLFVHALLPYLLPYIILTQWLLKIQIITKTAKMASLC